MIAIVIVLVVLAGGLLALLVKSCIASVPTGHTGIVTTFGHVEERTFEPGIHVKAPWNKVSMMDNRVQKANVNLSCFSSDIQEVNCSYTINYQIDRVCAKEIFRTVGKDYYTIVVTPIVAEAVKNIMAHYTAENLVGNRDSLTEEIEQYLASQLQKYNIQVVSTAIVNLGFTEDFINAVEAKQVAVQNKLRAQTEQEQLTMVSQQAAERARIDAEAAAEVAKIAALADLEVQKINADAAEYTGLKEAAKNKAISEYLTEELLKYYLIQQWNGEYPDTYLGESNVASILDLKK